MMSELGSGELLPPEATGVTVVTETGTVAGGGGVVSLALTPSLLAAPKVRITVAVFVPSFSAFGSETTVSVTPCGPRVPEDGVAVAHGLSVRAVNGTAGVRPGTKMVWRIVLVVPISTLVCFRGAS